MANVVLVLDMVRGFCEEGYPLYVGPTIREIVPRIQALLRREKAAGSRIIFLHEEQEEIKAGIAEILARMKEKIGTEQGHRGLRP